MVRRIIATGVGALVLATMALFPSIAAAQVDDDDNYEITTTTETVLGTTTVPGETTTTTEAPTTTAAPTTETVAPNIVVNPPTQPGPTVKGDVVSRPLPRTGNDIGGTAVFGGALTVLGIALALGARKRRNSFDGV